MVDFERNLQNVHSATFSSILNLLIIQFYAVWILTAEKKRKNSSGSKDSGPRTRSEMEHASLLLFAAAILNLVTQFMMMSSLLHKNPKGQEVHWTAWTNTLGTTVYSRINCCSWWVQFKQSGITNGYCPWVYTGISWIKKTLCESSQTLEKIHTNLTLGIFVLTSSYVCFPRNLSTSPGPDRTILPIELLFPVRNLVHLEPWTGDGLRLWPCLY